MKKILELYFRAQAWVLSTKIGREAMKEGANGAKEDIQKFFRNIFKRKNKPENKTGKIKPTKTFFNLNYIDMFKNLKDWKTTVPGILTILIFALHSMGIITPAEGQEITNVVDGIINSLGGGFVGITSAVLLGANALMLMFFAKDPKKDEK